jgi:acid phosphatase type 7
MMRALTLVLALCLMIACVLAYADFERVEDLPDMWWDTEFQNRRISEQQDKLEEVARRFRRSALGEGKSNGCKQCELATGLFFDLAQSGTALNATAGALLRDECKQLFNTSSFDTSICIDVVDALVVLVNEGLVQLQEWGVDFKEVACADFLTYCVKPCCTTPFAPEQVRLSFADSNPVGNATAMSVSWVTLEHTADAVVEWWVGNTTAPPSKFTSHTSWNTYTYGGWIGIIHNATMRGLTASTTYTYRVGSDAFGWSQEFSFVTLPLNIGTSERPLRVIGVADMGWGDNALDTIAAIQAVTLAGGIDFIVHPGDIGYADGNEAWWDVFGREMQSITSRVPYMTTMGNHESIWWNGTGYRERWFRPNAGLEAPADATFYQLNVGPVTFMMLDTENAAGTADFGQAQLNWMNVTFGNARNAGQLIFAAHHRPFYCSSNRSIADCTVMADTLRDQAEALYKRFGVAGAMCGHIHNYERTYPVYGNVTAANTTYDDPEDPYYIINGAGGNREGIATFYTTGNPWSAVRLTAVGYSIMEFSRDPQGRQDTFDMKFVEARSAELLDHVVLTKTVSTSVRD